MIALDKMNDVIDKLDKTTESFESFATICDELEDCHIEIKKSYEQLQKISSNIESSNLQIIKEEEEIQNSINDLNDNFKNTNDLIKTQNEKIRNLQDAIQDEISSGFEKVRKNNTDSYHRFSDEIEGQVKLINNKLDGQSGEIKYQLTELLNNYINCNEQLINIIKFNRFLLVMLTVSILISLISFFI